MNPKLFSLSFAALCACLAALLLSPSAHAGNASWNGTTDTNWSTATNWSGSSIPGVGNTATFNNAGNAKTTIAVGTISLSQISFNLAGAAAYTLGATPGTGTITFADGTTTAVTMASTVTANEIINANLTLGTALASATTFTNSSTTGSLTLGGNITGGSGGTAAAKTVIFTGAGNTTVGGVIGDGGASSLALTKSGPGGTLTLTGNNTYTGATTFTATSTAGIMNVNGASGALSGTSSLTISAFATFNLGDATNGLANRINPNASLTLGSDQGYGYLTVYRGSATANSQSFTSLNVGAAGMAQILTSGTAGGTPTLTFSGATPYVRGSGGMVNINPNSMPVSFTNAPSGAGNVANGILLGAVMNGTSFIKAQSGAATATSYVNDTWASGTYTTVTLASNTAYNNVTTAALRFAAPSTTVNLTGTNTIQSGGIIAGSGATGTGSTISGGTIQTGVAGGDLWVYAINSTTPLTIGSAIGDNGGSGLTVGSSNGVLTLTGSNSYAGATTITGGAVLNIQNSNALGTTAAGTTVSNGAGLYLQGDINVGAEDLTINGSGPGNLGGLRNMSGNNTWGGNVTIGSIGGRINSDSGTLTINGNISGSNQTPSLGLVGGNLTINGAMSMGTGSFTKNGNGTLTLNSANTFSGGVNIYGGPVVVGATGALGTSTGINLGYSGTTATDAPTILISGPYTVDRNITAGSQAAAGVAYNATLGGSNTSGTSTYTGNITLSTAANSYTFTLQAATGGTVEFKTGTWANTGNKTIAVGSAGNAGTVLISNALAGTGNVTVNAGTLQVTNNATLNSMTAVSVNNAGSTLAVNYGGGSDYKELDVNALLTKTAFNATTTAFAFDTTNGNGTYSTAFTKAAGLTKLGVNTLTLTAANTYTGGTTVTAGTLLVDVGASIGNGAVAVNGGQFTVNGVVGNGGVTVASGAFLGGNGTIGGTTIVNGNINPGNSPGTLSFTAGLTLNGTATMQITGKTLGAYDILYGNGSNTLTLGGTLALDNTGYTATYGDSIQIFKNWQTISGNFTSITGTGLNSGLSWDTANLGSTGFITVVPEPTTWALLAFSLTTVMVLRRRRLQ